MFKVIKEVAMLNGEIVEGIENPDTGVITYPVGTMIHTTVDNKKATAEKCSRQPDKLIDFNEIIEPDSFDNNYGWKQIEKGIKNFKDKEYLEKQKYWQSDEGQQRLLEMKYE